MSDASASAPRVEFTRGAHATPLDGIKDRSCPRAEKTTAPAADELTWEDRWERLSPESRRTFLGFRYHLLNPAYSYYSSNGQLTREYPGKTFSELREAGFIQLGIDPRTKTERVELHPAARPFTLWLGAIQHARFLHEGVDGTHFIHPLLSGLTTERKTLLKKIARRSEFPHATIEEIVTHHIANGAWPGLVAANSGIACAVEVVEGLFKQKEPLPLAEIANQFPNIPLVELRPAVAALREGLALFDEIDHVSGRIRVGIMHQARQSRAIARKRPATRPPLTPCPTPLEMGPSEGMLIPDLRAMLIELVHAPARLKQNQEYYQKEIERIESVFEPAPDWLMETSYHSIDGRFARVDRMATRMVFLRITRGDDRMTLDAMPAGQEWLQLPARDQYEAVAAAARQYNQTAYWGGWDYDFLGFDLTLTFGKNRSQKPASGRVMPEQVDPLRNAVADAFSTLEPETFYHLDDLVAHLTYGDANPFRLGKPPGETVLWHRNESVSPFAEMFEDASARAIRSLIVNRLIPFGALLAGRDSKKKLCVARRSLLDIYFGREPAIPLPKTAARDESKVIVQPDFTVLIIGLNPIPAADLAPFCERKPGRASQGSLHFQLTRASVIKAASAGMTAEEMLKRLDQHSSVPLPSNVRTEIQTWAGSIRHITATESVVLHCPDAATADRVKSALGSKAARIGDAVVAYPAEEFTPGVRAKLHAAGLVLPKPQAKPQTMRRRR